MSHRSGLVVALLIGVCACARAQDDAATLEDAFTDCLEATTDPQYADDCEEGCARATLADVCPGLSDAIAASGLTDLLYDDWDDMFSRSGVLDLWSLSQLRASSPRGRELTTDDLPQVLDGLRQSEASAPSGWWSRFKAWVRSLFESRVEQREARESFQIPQRVTEIVAYVLLAATLVALFVIVYRELRAAGVLERGSLRRSRDALLAGSAATGADDPTTRRELLARALLAEQPSLVLHLLVAELGRTERLTDRRSFTHRELERAARLDTPQDASVFRSLLRTAETLLYGDRAPSEQEISSVVDDGLALVERIAPRTA